MFQLSFSILLFTAFLRSIPLELEESARIDGATTWQTFWQLIFPLLAPDERDGRRSSRSSPRGTTS